MLCVTQTGSSACPQLEGGQGPGFGTPGREHHLCPATDTFQQGGRHSLSATAEPPPSWELSLKTEDGGQGRTPSSPDQVSRKVCVWVYGPGTQPRQGSHGVKGQPGIWAQPGGSARMGADRCHQTNNEAGDGSYPACGGAELDHLHTPVRRAHHPVRHLARPPRLSGPQLGPTCSPLSGN